MFTWTFSRWIISLVTAVAMLVVINTLLSQPAAQARHAATTTTCLGSIQACIDAALDGDTILIPAGTYTESLTLSKPVSLTGVNSATTILHAVANQRVLTVTGATISNSVVISGLMFTGGDVRGGSYVCPQNCGGGMLITDTAQPVLANIIVISNSATYAGGILAPTLILIDSIVSSNSGGGAVASTAIITGGQFANNTDYSGLTAETLILTGTRFISNTAYEGGGVYVSGSATIADGLFENNHCVGDYCEGGGFYADYSLDGSVALSNTAFVSNSAYSGGGVFSYKPVTVVSGRFESNTAWGTWGAAGGMWVYNSPLTMINTEVISNTAVVGGGGVVAHPVATIVNSRFESNSSYTSFGGGLYAPAVVHLTNTQFVSNSAAAEGGGAQANQVYLNGGLFERNRSLQSFGGGLATGDLVMSSTMFVSNTAQSMGGGAYIYNQSIIDDSQFKSNSAQSGGGVEVNGPTMITNSNFISNSAQDGGGLFAHDVVTLTHANFFSNTAQLNCGGACLGGPSIVNGGRFINNHALAANSDSGGLGTDLPTTINGTEFISNSASVGGGMYANYTATLYNARFDSNSASIYGGGLFAEHTWVITGATFTNNTAAKGGGITVGEISFITNAKFVGNSASLDGGGLVAGYKQATIANVLFARNTASRYGAGLYVSGSGQLQILHTTIASPTLVPIEAIHFAHGTLYLTDTLITSHTVAISNTGGTVYEDYNLFFGNVTNTSGSITSGGHSLIGDPRFVDPVNGDYHLRFPSLAIDHGANVGVYTDLDGIPRPVGLGFDIGAYEYQGPIAYLFLPIIRK